MIIHFFLRYYTRVGQSILVTGNINALGNNTPDAAYELTYFNNDFWYGTIDLPETVNEKINYSYILRETGQIDVFHTDKNLLIIPKVHKGKEIVLIDTWNAANDIKNVFYTKPFLHTWQQTYKPPKIKSPILYTHEFKIKAPLLNTDEWICITGSGKLFENWDVKKLLPLNVEGNWFTIKINLSKQDFPVNYKYGIYNSKNKSFTYEDGANRTLQMVPGKKQITILHDGFINLQRSWKSAGIAIPVFSLRSKNSFGTGEFNDIKLLVDWAKQTGLKLLQLLPINDTTSSNTEKDSYPYSAISAFALHPLYINLDAVAGTQHSALVKSLSKKKKSLQLQSDLQYAEVMKFKISILKEIFLAKKETFLKDKNYLEFFESNREWLVPYSAFCFLRDKNQTADFTKWKSNKIYQEDAIRKLVSTSKANFDEICFNYFIQYHLHLQLKAASEYAHKNGIILKGDIPIGVSPHSCDVWVDPSLYNTNEQAGAPPDNFAVKGQNWGFPTYNWDKMKQDNYAWWSKRFTQMNNYFDAFRIDHILGFFRIWSVPKDAVEGILGRFVPAIPIHITEFNKTNIWFDYTRYCKPFINENILEELFGDKSNDIKKTFLNIEEDDTYQLKEEFNTQRKVEKYFEEIEVADMKIKQGLFDLISNVILIEVEGSQMQEFHFRISMQQTTSFQQLDENLQQQLSVLYSNYFYTRQNALWKNEALQKLPALKRSTDMLICGEDLGMMPHCVPEVMKQSGILSLEIQRMPKDPSVEFFQPSSAPYLSVVTPSTHDMSTLREWWLEDNAATQKFYNNYLGQYGKAPAECKPWIIKEIILQHLRSPAMWSIFQIQDLLGMSEKLKRSNPLEERINQPANPDHHWKYRMHLNLEDLIKEKDFSKELKTLIIESGRV